MSLVTELAWQFVTLALGGLVLWRADAWINKRMGSQAALKAFGALEERQGKQEQAVWAQFASQAERLEKLETALRGPTPAADKRNQEALNRFR